MISVFTILVVIALVLAVVALIKPSWPPLIPVAVILITIALLIERRGF